jgi:hypothetical protein
MEKVTCGFITEVTEEEHRGGRRNSRTGYNDEERYKVNSGVAKKNEGPIPIRNRPSVEFK